MATRPLPPPERDQTHNKTHTTGTLLEMIRSASKRSTFQNLHGVMEKRWLRIVGIVVAILVVLLIALPFLINVNSFRPKIESEAANALGRQVKLGDLSLSILSGSVGVEDISIAEDPAFSKSSFITAKSLKVGVELMPLIFSKQLNVTGIALNEPEITLLKATNGRWNFSSLGATDANKPPESQKSTSTTPKNFSVAKLEIKNGKLNVGNANSSAKAQVYDKLNVEVTNFSFVSQFPFKLATGLPGEGNATVSGKAGPINQNDMAKTPLEASLKVKNMNLATSGFIDAASGIGGLANFEASLNSTAAKPRLWAKSHATSSNFRLRERQPESSDDKVCRRC